MTTASTRNKLRIISGKWRSRRISFPDLPGLRPTADRIRETLFNWLQDQIPGENCLDLFAGSGACGIEALSRGARSTLFIESHNTAARALLENLNILQADGGSVKQTDALAWLASQQVDFKNQIGIAFIDPPYALNLEYKAAELLEQSGVLKPAAKIYIESDELLDEERLPGNWTKLKQKKAGAVHYYLFERSLVEGQ